MTEKQEVLTREEIDNLLSGIEEAPKPVVKDDADIVQRIDPFKSDVLADMYHKTFSVCILDKEHNHQITISMMWGSRMGKWGRKCTVRMAVSLNSRAIPSAILERIKQMGFNDTYNTEAFVMYGVFNGLAVAHCIDDFRDLFTLVFGIRFSRGRGSNVEDYQSYIHWLAANYDSLFRQAGCTLVYP